MRGSSLCYIINRFTTPCIFSYILTSQCTLLSSPLTFVLVSILCASNAVAKNTLFSIILPLHIHSDLVIIAMNSQQTLAINLIYQYGFTPLNLYMFRSWEEWPKAIRFYCFRSVSIGTKNKTPFETWNPHLFSFIFKSFK